MANDVTLLKRRGNAKRLRGFHRVSGPRSIAHQQPGRGVGVSGCRPLNDASPGDETPEVGRLRKTGPAPDTNIEGRHVVRFATPLARDCLGFSSSPGKSS